MTRTRLANLDGLGFGGIDDHDAGHGVLVVEARLAPKLLLAAHVLCPRTQPAVNAGLQTHTATAT
jgi:hypothetical protein